MKIEEIPITHNYYSIFVCEECNHTKMLGSNNKKARFEHCISYLINNFHWTKETGSMSFGSIRWAREDEFYCEDCSKERRLKNILA